MVFIQLKTHGLIIGSWALGLYNMSRPIPPPRLTPNNSAPMLHHHPHQASLYHPSLHLGRHIEFLWCQLRSRAFGLISLCFSYIVISPSIIPNIAKAQNLVPQYCPFSYPLFPPWFFSFVISLPRHWDQEWSRNPPLQLYISWYSILYTTENWNYSVFVILMDYFNQHDIL